MLQVEATRLLENGAGAAADLGFFALEMQALEVMAVNKLGDSARRAPGGEGGRLLQPVMKQLSLVD